MQDSTIIAQDGTHLHVSKWFNCSHPQALLVIVHGLVEHAGRYRPLAEWLNAANIAVLSFDLRGHGRSAGKPMFFNHFDILCDDLNRVLTHVLFEEQAFFKYVMSCDGQSDNQRVIQPKTKLSASCDDDAFLPAEQITKPLPIFILGHSMGGAISAYYLTLWQKKMAKK